MEDVMLVECIIQVYGNYGWHISRMYYMFEDIALMDDVMLLECIICWKILH